MKSWIARLESAGKHAPAVASLKRYAEAVGCTLKIELVPANRKRRKNKSFDKLRTNGNLLIPFVVSLSNHERNQLVQRFPSHPRIMPPFSSAIGSGPICNRMNNHSMSTGEIIARPGK